MKQKQHPHVITLIIGIILSAVFTAPSAIAQGQSPGWYSFEEAIERAEEIQQPILVDVWAPWCGWCKKMQKEVYPAIPDSLSSEFIWTRLNRDDNNSRIQFRDRSFTPLRLAQSLNTQDVPALVFLTAKGKYLFHTSGFTELNTLQPLLEYVASNAYQQETFEEYLEP